MNKDLRQLIEQFTTGTPEELEDAKIFLAMVLEFYSILPGLRRSRKSHFAYFVPEKFLNLEVTADELREVVRVIAEDGADRIDPGVCFWMLGKPSQDLGAVTALRLLEAKHHLLDEAQAVQAATTLRRILVRPDPELEVQLRSAWFRTVLREWLGSESGELKKSARSLGKLLSTRWGISV